MMITLVSPTGQTIHTDSNPCIQAVLEVSGVNWIDALHGPVEIPKDAFDAIDHFISVRTQD